MNYSLIIRPKAQAEIREAARWYEKQRKGLGSQFLQSADQAMDGLRSTPKMHAIAIDNVRRKLLRRFPYFLYYQVEETRVVVIGVFHTSRDPQTWQDRVKGDAE